VVFDPDSRLYVHIDGRVAILVYPIFRAITTGFIGGLAKSRPEKMKAHFQKGSLSSLRLQRIVPSSSHQVSFELAVAVMLQGMTAHYLVTDTCPLARGDTVLVHAAAGGLGLLLVQAAAAPRSSPHLHREKAE
jgi:hypothetical protein